MSNVLRREKQEQVLALGRLGWPLRRIQESLGVRRETVARYLRAAGIVVRAPRARAMPKAASQVSPDPDALALAATLAEPAVRPGRSPQASACEPWRELIEAELAKGRTAKSIWQDLVDVHGFGGRYASVKRFAVRYRGDSGASHPHAVILTAPGEEAQVDYGDGPMVRHPETGKYRRTRMFVLVLGHSRKAVRLLVWKSSTQVWAELHERAFARLGGCPRVIVLDNLREGVLKPDVYDPTLNPVYRDVLAHYGAVALPCRVRDPDRKGKVESGVKHAQMKLRGLRFETLEQAQAYLDRWETTWADTRIHGTTKRQVAAMFVEEKPALLALPAERFRYYQFATRPVHIHGYVEVAGGYYAPPLTHLTGSLHVQWDDLRVRLLDPKTGQLLVEHDRTRPGGYRRREQDQPARTLPGVAALLGRARKAGKAIGSLCDAIHERRREQGTRQIQGVLRLARDHGVPAVEDACATALELGVIEYRFVKRYLARVRAAMPDLVQVDPLIRELTHYRDIIHARTGGTES